MCRYGAAAVLGNSDPLGMWRINVKKFGIKQGELWAASYPAHLSEHEHTRYTDITNDYQILLFHYVTRAQHNFVERKINLRSGVYATTYAEIAGNATADTDTDELYKRFEHEYGFDGEHEICKQGAGLHSAMEAARASGEWNPIPDTPGLIAQPEPEVPPGGPAGGPKVLRGPSGAKPAATGAGAKPTAGGAGGGGNILRGIRETGVRWQPDDTARRRLSGVAEAWADAEFA